jgi:hypothetical protein
LIAVERSYSVMLDNITISNWEGIIVTSIFTFSHQIRTMFVGGGEKKFLGLGTANLAIEPTEI